MRAEIETRIRHDAAADAAFRAALISDPVTAISEQYGTGTPDGITLRVIEEGADEVILVLPFDRSALQLSESDLDAATGAAYGDQGPSASATGL